MNKVSNNIQTASVLIPVFGGFIILYGGVSLTMYYSQFGFDIFPFVTFSEIVVLFLSDLKFGLFITFYFAFLFLGSNNRRIKAARTADSSQVEEIKKLEKRIDFFDVGLVILLTGSLILVQIPNIDWLSVGILAAGCLLTWLIHDYLSTEYRELAMLFRRVSSQP